ncbi:diguanylate cyclase (GGDEF) domain-containing protein [Lachnospiraceae bacterium XBB1006]|nr:diguanylate cyclase (GGDEF) domain-containing protein [Lachnospiraceae bacterium XBB1006]
MKGRLAAVFSIAIAGVFVLLSVSAYNLYDQTKENIVHIGQVRALQSAQLMNDYLQTGVNAVDLAAFHVEDMMRQGSSYEEIKSYLVFQSEQYSVAISENYNGIYGLIDGRYLDGTGWEARKDFHPETRKWYKKAMKNMGTTTLVSPYKDIRSGIPVMSIAKRLSDGKSVVAMDLVMDGLLELKNHVTMAENMDFYFFLIDEDGQMVDFSYDSEEKAPVGMKPEEMVKVIEAKKEKTQTNYFDITMNGTGYFVYEEPLKNQWNAVSVINKREMFSGMIMVETLVTIMMVAFVFLSIAIALSISRRQAEREEVNQQLLALTDIYNSMYTINLKTNRIVKISGTSEENLDLLMGGKDHADVMLQMMMEFYAATESKREMMEFVNLFTLAERLREGNTITKEFLNHHNYWCRARFLVVERRNDATPKKVMWLIEEIDEEKRHRDYLKYLSEMDQMSGVMNRTSGENRISEQLKKKRGGLFMLLDVDKFKSINDSYGHEVGDRVIVELAASLQKVAKKDDIVLRLGGDEFAAYADAIVSKEEAKARIEAFLESLESVNIPELEGQTIEVSMGAVLFKSDEVLSFDELYRMADLCTYCSKEHSGSYVTFSDELSERKDE